MRSKEGQMRFILGFTLLFFIVSCSSPKKAPEIKKVVETVEKKALPEPESPPAVVNDVSAPQPQTEDSGLPDITGNSILDVNCAMGQDRRLISILERTDDRGWGVVYEKFGTRKTIAIARNDKSFCDEIVERVKGKLQTAGFQCDGDVEASSSPVSGGAEEEAPAQSEPESAAPEKPALEKAVDKVQQKVEEVKEGIKEEASKAGE